MSWRADPPYRAASDPVYRAPAVDPTYRGPVTVARPAPWKPLVSFLTAVRNRVSDWLRLEGRH